MLEDNPALTNRDVAGATQIIDVGTGDPGVDLTFTQDGKTAFHDLTRAVARRGEVRRRSARRTTAPPCRCVRWRSTMADATTLFFDELARRGREPLLGGAVGSVRFELARDSRVHAWRVALDDGVVSVSRDEAGADCVVRADMTLFDGIVTGQVNAMAALLRGALTFEGDPELLVRLQRLFPSPPGGAGSARAADRR